MPTTYGQTYTQPPYWADPTWWDFSRNQPLAVTYQQMGVTGQQTTTTAQQQSANPAMDSAWSALSSTGIDSLFGSSGTEAAGQEIIGTMMDGSSMTAGVDSVGAMGGALPTAGVILAALAAARGLGEAHDTWQSGGGNRQRAVAQTLNPVGTGILGVLGAEDNTAANYAAAALMGPLALAPLALDSLGVNFFSGKDKGQMERDNTRKQLQEAGLIDENFNMKLGDTTSDFNLGYDGNYSLQNKGQNINNSNTRHAYDVDWSDPNARRYLDAIDPFVASVLNDYTENSKRRSDLSGMLYNRIATSDNPEAAFEAFQREHMKQTPVSEAQWMANRLNNASSGGNLNSLAEKLGGQPAANNTSGNTVADKNAGKKTTDPDYDWNFARAYAKGQAKW